MRTDDFDYPLPEHLIAQRPAAERAGSRLLVVPPAGSFSMSGFRDLPELLAPGDLLVFNDTRVIAARLHGVKASGGRIELLIEEVLDHRRALARTRSSKPLRPGGALEVHGPVGGRAGARCVARIGERWELEFERPLEAVLREFGHVPLPPYIERADEPVDAERYQTIFSRVEGAIAAPTAALHFDQALMEAISARGVETTFITLHVGAGTFAPVRAEDPREHLMHQERFVLGKETVAKVLAARRAGRRVVAVGTTAVRALESASAAGTLAPREGRTELFIMPGYRFRSVDALITNFHLPRSTLLMLVSAFAGRERILSAYAHAVDHAMRFFSYGDAMFLTGPPAPPESTS